MKPCTRHIVVNLLLLSYMLLGVIGHFETLTVRGFGTNPQHFEQAKTSTPPAAKVYWTQNKHIPSIIKISVPSPAVITPPDANRLNVYDIIYRQETTQHYINPVVLLHSSRAPPLV